MTCDRSEPDKLELLVLCRTQGKDLHSYMFKGGSNVAISVLNNILVEVADLAYEALRAAAKDLRRTALWAKVSKMAPKRSERPTTEDIEELLFLVASRPLLHKVGRLDAEKVAMVIRSGIDWQNSCVAMENEPSFSPSHVFQSAGANFYLFYLRDDDCFLLFQVDEQGQLRGLNFVSKGEKLASDETMLKVIQKLINYLLYYIWFGI